MNCSGIGWVVFSWYMRPRNNKTYQQSRQQVRTNERTNELDPATTKPINKVGSKFVRSFVRSFAIHLQQPQKLTTYNNLQSWQRTCQWFLKFLFFRIRPSAPHDYKKRNRKGGSDSADSMLSWTKLSNNAITPGLVYSPSMPRSSSLLYNVFFQRRASPFTIPSMPPSLVIPHPSIVLL